MTSNYSHGILIVDDSMMNREILRDILSNQYQIFEANNGVKAIEQLNAHALDIHLILLDINMPDMDGFQVLDEMERRGWIEEMGVIIISAENSKDMMETAYDKGVDDFISRPFDAFIVRRRVANTIALYAKQRKLEEMIVDQLMKNEQDNRLMISILSHIVEFRNGESGVHIMHINTLTEMLLERLVEITDKYPLSPMDINLISTASSLHDIGKISIPSTIINKPGRLTSAEFEIMKQHSLCGADMLKSLEAYQSEKLVGVAYEICRWHHERYDGNGYPDGLKGDEIPITAQVVSLTDVYDALTSERCYKKAFTHEKTMEMILNGECGQFNPLLLRAFQDIADEIPKRLEQSNTTHHNKAEIQAIAAALLETDELKSFGSVH